MGVANTECYIEKDINYYLLKKNCEFYYYSRLPVTRWVKLSLNFELLVKGVMKFLLGQRLFNNNIFCTT